MNEAVDPNNTQGVSDEHALLHAELGLVKSRLEGIVETLPTIAANDNVRRQLDHLLGHVKGQFASVRADIMRERLGDLPD